MIHEEPIIYANLSTCTSEALASLLVRSVHFDMTCESSASLTLPPRLLCTHAPPPRSPLHTHTHTHTHTKHQTQHCRHHHYRHDQRHRQRAARRFLRYFDTVRNEERLESLEGKLTALQLISTEYSAWRARQKRAASSALHGTAGAKVAKKRKKTKVKTNAT